MKVLIVSDNHRSVDTFAEVIKKVGQPDFLIHAGDMSGSEELIERSVMCPVKMVLGNNDYNPRYRHEEVFDLYGHRVLLTHGHRDGVYFGTDRLFYRAAELGADIVVYGHTHIPSIEYDEELGIWAVNPGSLTYPRQAGHRPSYVIMETNGEDKVDFQLKFV